MTAAVSIVLLLAINIGLLWLLMAAPVGQRTITVRRNLAEDPERLWRAIRHAGDAASWSPDIAATRSGTDAGLEDGQVEVSLRHPDRRGQPIRRIYDVIERRTGDNGYASSARVVADSTLASSFWSRFHDERRVEPQKDGAILTLSQSDHYRGLAFYLFRRFMMRRDIAALEKWLQTGKRHQPGFAGHPLLQIALAALSTLLLWPFFGLNQLGLAISIILTMVIVLHELGHMIAYRTFGHERVMLIFVPMLGGIAVGGRPYKSRFEVATCALMGAGFSAFLVPVLILVKNLAHTGVLPHLVHAPALVFLLVLGSFNLLNLLPMHRFDGGQVIRQVFPGKFTQLVASFGLTAIVLVVGYEVGIPTTALLAGLAVFTLLSLIGFRGSVMRDELEPMQPGERLMAGFGLYAAISIHAHAIIIACDHLFRR